MLEHGAARGALRERIHTAPRPVERKVSEARLADLASRHQLFRQALATPRLRRLFSGLADHSPYLWGLIESDPERCIRLLDNDPDARLEAIIRDLEAGVADDDESVVMRRLRRAKQELALLVALCDIGGVWRLEDVVQALSRGADALIGDALAHLLRRAHREGRLRLSDPGQPHEGCGLAVLGLGKLGGRELNYSSDVDLVAIFDPACPALVKPDEAKALYVRLVQGLVRLLQQPTADGFCLRVDLRLRPDPGSTAVAIGLGAAFLYYEAYGQNWERAALIKARPIAGDRAVGARFIEELSPFVWRKYFDYAAIADIHAMKRQIHAVKGHAEIAVAGHDVKLGRGGIREIEFFVQTQQLVFGGKRVKLRGSRTLEMLHALRRDGWISSRAVGDLARAYAMLRRIEHRLQMIADAQTQRLPKDEAALEQFARFCGFASAARFGRVLMRHLRAVTHHYGRLFESAPGLDDASGSLVFTGVGDDQETLETLRALGYRAPEVVSRRVREWHSGQRAAVRTARARETLTELVPKLLVAFAKSADPDGAVAAFDKALERMSGAGELFAILAAQEKLRELFGDILGSAPRLAATVGLHPHLLDAAINPASEVLFDEDAATARLAQVLARARTTEDVLDGLRDAQREDHFLVDVRLLAGDLEPDEAATAYGALAVGVVRVALARLREAFVLEHGEVAGGRVAVVALGKLGSREMTATSDLDLMLVYDFDADAPQSDGPRPLHATQYYARLAQRLVSHLTVATRRGGLYAVDMRLRPSGNQGPLATKFASFSAYQRNEAATWERMALTRARTIAGDASLQADVGREIARLLRRPADAHLARDVREMRALIEREKPGRDAWDLKYLPGGLVDLEFVAQYLVLRHAATHADVLATSTRDILVAARDLGLVERVRADGLIAAHRLLSGIAQVMRLSLEPGRAAEEAGAGVERRLAAVAQLPDVGRLADEVTATRQAVRESFEALIPTD